jgi:ankyrin repeat protein
VQEVSAPENAQKKQMSGDRVRVKQVRKVLWDAAQRGCAAGAAGALRDMHARAVPRFTAQALWEAVRVSVANDHPDTTHALLGAASELGIATPELTAPRAMHVAAKYGSTGAMRVLLEAKAGANTAGMRYVHRMRRRSLVTPLDVACRHGQAAAVAVLLTYKADAEWLGNVDAQGGAETPLLLAVESGFADVARTLLAAKASADRHVVSRGGGARTPLGAAAAAGDVTLVRMLLDCKAGVDLAFSGSLSPLAGASRAHASVTDMLLRRKADVNARSGQSGVTALHTAACVPCATGILQMLLCAGADVDAADSAGETPLMRAVQFNRRGVVRTLLQHGACVDHADRDGRTPLILASICRANETASLLLASKADAARTDSAGRTAQDWARLRLQSAPAAR